MRSLICWAAVRETGTRLNVEYEVERRVCLQLITFELLGLCEGHFVGAEFEEMLDRVERGSETVKVKLGCRVRYVMKFG